MLAAISALRATALVSVTRRPRIPQRCLKHEAAALIIAHNHPSGSVEPSRADELLTKTLGTALALMDVRVLDHIIVAGGRSLSFAQRGLL